MQLAQIHSFRGMPGRADDAASDAALARQALEYFEKAYSLTADPLQRSYLLSDLAKAAMDSGDRAKAKEYATQNLAAAKSHPKDWNCGNAIYNGNCILGRVALAGGDVESAKAYLLAAGQTPGSPQLNSFGPNMTLARDLLAKGE